MTRPDYQMISHGRTCDCCIAIASSEVGHKETLRTIEQAAFSCLLFPQERTFWFAVRRGPHPGPRRGSHRDLMPKHPSVPPSTVGRLIARGALMATYQRTFTLPWSHIAPVGLLRPIAKT